MSEVKCVVVGGGGVGKTCFVQAAALGEFPREYIPTVFDNMSVDVQVGDINVNIKLFDTAGQEDYDRLRPLSYPGADVFIICFPILNSTRSYNSQLETVNEFWVSEIRHYSSTVPMILMGTKLDLRDSTDEYPSSTFADGLKVAQNIQAVQYLEVSALDYKGIKAALQCVAKVALQGQPETTKSSKCSIA